jgi:hypothetical protein
VNTPPESIRAMSLDSNPFRLLQVSTRDDRRRILEAADERGLHLDQALCQQARADLTNPRTRVSAEMGWLPGLSPRMAEILVKRLHTDPWGLVELKLPGLAKANLVAAAIEIEDFDLAVSDEVATYMLTLGSAVEELNSEAILLELNEDRAVAGFPEVRDLASIEEELIRRRKYFTQVLKTALDKMPSSSLISTVTLLVQRATDSGRSPAPLIVDELVDTYALETQTLQDREEQILATHIERARAAGPSGGAAVDHLLVKIEQVARNFHRLVLPIQLSMKARGMGHDTSGRVGFRLRGLAVSLFREYGLLRQSQRVTALLQELFVEHDEVAEQAAQDAKALDELAREAEFEKALTSVRAACGDAVKSADASPSSADARGLALATEVPKLLEKAGKAGVPDEMLRLASDQAAHAVVYCAIEYGNKMSGWARCIEVLTAARTLSTSKESEARIAESLVTVRRNLAMLANLQPVDSAPSLSTINGIGFALYGSSDLDVASSAYTTTLYFVILFIPIFPIRRYRVISLGSSYRFLGQGPLRTFDKVHLALVCAFIAFLFLKG